MTSIDKDPEWEQVGPGGWILGLQGSGPLVFESL